jgi:hypothetical protein
LQVLLLLLGATLSASGQAPAQIASTIDNDPWFVALRNSTDAQLLEIVRREGGVKGAAALELIRDGSVVRSYAERQTGYEFQSAILLLSSDVIREIIAGKTSWESPDLTVAKLLASGPYQRRTFGEWLAIVAGPPSQERDNARTIINAMGWKAVGPLVLAIVKGEEPAATIAMSLLKPGGGGPVDLARVIYDYRRFARVQKLYREFASNRIVTARLHDRFTGEPAPAISIDTGGLEVTSSSDGRLEITPPLTSGFLQLAGRSVYSREPVVDAGGTTIRVAADAPTSDLGLVYVDAGLANRFAPVCDDQRVSGTPRSPILVFAFNPTSKAWEHNPERADRLMRLASVTAKSVVCVKFSEAEVGFYQGSATRAMREVADASAIRLSDGKRFRQTFRADPPSSVTSRGGFISSSEAKGDATQQIATWLVTLFKN